MIPTPEIHAVFPLRDGVDLLDLMDGIEVLAKRLHLPLLEVSHHWPAQKTRPDRGQTTLEDF